MGPRGPGCEAGHPEGYYETVRTGQPLDIGCSLGPRRGGWCWITPTGVLCVCPTDALSLTNHGHHAAELLSTERDPVSEGPNASPASWEAAGSESPSMTRQWPFQQCRGSHSPGPTATVVSSCGRILSSAPGASPPLRWLHPVPSPLASPEDPRGPLLLSDTPLLPFCLRGTRSLTQDTHATCRK